MAGVCHEVLGGESWIVRIRRQYQGRPFPFIESGLSALQEKPPGQILTDVNIVEGVSIIKQIRQTLEGIFEEDGFRLPTLE